MRVFIAVILIVGLSPSSEGQKAYEMEMVDFEAIPGDEVTLVDFSNVKLIGRERFFNGSFTYAEDMDDEQFTVNAEILTSPMGDGNYKLSMDVPPTSICKAMKDFHPQYMRPILITGVNTDIPDVPDEGLCPIPAGTFSLYSVELKTDSFPNVLPYGLLKTIFKVMKNGENVGGFITVANVKRRSF